MVFDRDSTSGLVEALPDSALTPEQVRDFRLLGLSDDRAVARYFPELEETLHQVFHEAGRCGGYTLHGSLAAALAEADNPLYSRKYLDRSGVAPAAIDQQAHVVPALELVDAERIVDTIEWLQDMDTRYYLTPEGQDAALALQAQWEGYRSRRSDFSVTRFEHPWVQDSVIASIEGSVHPDDIVLLGGHLDSINVFGRLAPGADDNASGIAAMSEVLRVTLASGFRPRRTLQFIAYAAEEVGLRGSREIARAYELAGKNVVAAMQLDLTGFPGSPHDMYFVTDYVSTDLTNFVKNLIGEYNGPGPHEITFGDTACGYACSDHAAWTEVGVPAVHPFETVVEDRNPVMHTAHDTLDRMDSTGRKSALFAKLGLEFMMEVSKADDAPSVTVAFESAAYTVTEGGTVTVPVRLSETPTPTRPVSIGLTATPGLGATAADYTVPTAIAFERGETRALVEVVSLPDAKEDDGETVTLGFGGHSPQRRRRRRAGRLHGHHPRSDGPWTDLHRPPHHAWGDSAQGGSLPGAAGESLGPAGAGGPAARAVDRSDPAGPGHAGETAARDRAARRTRRGVRRDGEAAADLHGPGADSRSHPRQGRTRDGASPSGPDVGVTR